MNKRQAKKKFEKEHGYNPTKKPELPIDGLDLNSDFEQYGEMLVAIIRFIAVGIVEFGKICIKIPSEINLMSDEEFEKLCAELPTIESQALAKRIRGK